MSRTTRNPPTFEFQGRRDYGIFREPACGSRLRGYQSSLDQLGEFASNRIRSERGRIRTSYDDINIAGLGEAPRLS